MYAQYLRRQVNSPPRLDMVHQIGHHSFEGVAAGEVESQRSQINQSVRFSRIHMLQMPNVMSFDAPPPSQDFDGSSPERKLTCRKPSLNRRCKDETKRLEMIVQGAACSLNQ